ncbi:MULTISPECIES: NUDIX hydrolase [unclassified Marinovum]
MKQPIQRAWREILRPLYKRPNEFQVAALCYQGKGALRRILLITSRDTGRWVLPKGWPIHGEDGPGSAAIEAWEEAGVTPAKVGKQAFGTFQYKKRLDDGWEIPVDTKVYKIKVADLAETFPEAGERKRVWVTPNEAANMVDETGLRALLEAV